MNGNNQELNERLAHRKRIQRMKTGLVWFLATWMLAWMVISVTLIFKVQSLQKQMDILMENTIRSQQVEQKEHKISQADDVQKYETPTESDDETQAGQAHTKASSEDGDGADTAESAKADVKKDASSTPDADDEDEGKKVYLTFDDGPSANTKEIMDVLDKYHVKATFFVTGRDDKESVDLYKEIVERGHTLGMHSYSHKYEELYSSLKSFKKDLERIRSRIYEATGIECKLYRFPGGSSNQVSSTDMKVFIRYLNKIGVTYFDWNAECGDATSHDYTPKQMVENVMGDVEKHRTSVVLMHDAVNKANTVKALPSMIKKIQAAGAKILPIEQNTTLVQHVSADSVEE